ncbi:TSC22 domain family protein 1-like isoform X1 [Eucyclogobius newberryi]|uniref:TSC22 domain family protein 1-like isoform X1 n=1 Tax=Eucyclogobius newberryi TaxID=166745 RepID=UPI003B5B5C1F
MQQQDLTEDLPCTSSCTGPEARKSAYHQRRGSSVPGTSNVTVDESGAQAGFSSPASHQQCQGPGAQVKKKSGFQITSVTSAQINVSGNNSLADDTESYDDMDESHMEDLSSSDLLDASRATDTGVPGRSSSDETLNSLHGVDTPGLVSPNEHVHSHVPQVSLVNGTVNLHVSPQPHLHKSVPGREAAVLLPIAPFTLSSPDLPKVGTSQSQRTPMLNKSKPTGDTHPDLDLQSSVAPAAEPNVGVESGAPSTQSQYPQTQGTPGSRFRVVKLDTNSEPFRKGRWTCTEFYEKDLPHLASEALKGVEVSAESEAANVGISSAAPLQSYQLLNQDISSAPAMKSPPQGLPQTAALSYVPVQKTLVTTAPFNILPQQLPYTVDPHKPFGVYLQHSTSLPPANIPQPDFIQPTAPFQSQVQPPLACTSTGVPHMSVPAQLSVSITKQLGAQSLGSPSPQAFLPNMAPSLQLHPQSLVQPTALQGSVGPPSGAQVLPLTALQADLQPLLAPTANMRSSHLEDAHRLLFQHQGLLGLPRLGAPGAEGAMESGNAGAALAHMGMSAEANAFMAAAASLRSHTDGENDSSSAASVVAIDNKIEQAMDLVKSHLMYAVREEVEVLKEQINELIERNSQLEQENNLLKNLASPEQMALFQAQVQTGSSPTGPDKPAVGSVGTQAALPPSQNIGMST